MSRRGLALPLIAAAALLVPAGGSQARVPAAPKARAAAAKAHGTTHRPAKSRRRPATPRISFGRRVGGLASFAGLTATPAAPARGPGGLLAPAAPILAPLVPAAATPAPAPSAPDPASTPTPASSTPAPAPAAPGGPATLGIQVDETPSYTMVLSRQVVPAGSVRLQLQNTGEDAHNVLVAPADGSDGGVVVPLTEPGRTSTKTVTLAPGSYRLFCTLTTPVVHEAAGMRATLTVTG